MGDFGAVPEPEGADAIGEAIAEAHLIIADAARIGVLGGAGLSTDILTSSPTSELCSNEEAVRELHIQG